MTEKEIALSRVANGIRDVVRFYDSWEKAERRKAEAVKAAYGAGATESELASVVSRACSSNEKTREAFNNYHNAMMEIKERRNA